MRRYKISCSTANGPLDPVTVDRDADPLVVLADVLTDVASERARLFPENPIGFRTPLTATIEELPLKTFIIHADVDYVTKQKETGETYAATTRPTLTIAAADLEEALEIAAAQETERISTEWWPVVSLKVTASLTRELDS